MIRLEEHDEALRAINAVLTNGGIVEVKNEAHGGEVNIVVVEIIRSVKTKREKRNK